MYYTSTSPLFISLQWGVEHDADNNKKRLFPTQFKTLGGIGISSFNGYDGTFKYIQTDGFIYDVSNTVNFVDLYYIAIGK